MTDSEHSSRPPFPSAMPSLHANSAAIDEAVGTLRTLASQHLHTDAAIIAIEHLNEYLDVRLRKSHATVVTLSDSSLTAARRVLVRTRRGMIVGSCYTSTNEGHVYRLRRRVNIADACASIELPADAQLLLRDDDELKSLLRGDPIREDAEYRMALAATDLCELQCKLEYIAHPIRPSRHAIEAFVISAVEHVFTPALRTIALSDIGALDALLGVLPPEIRNTPATGEPWAGYRDAHSSLLSQLRLNQAIRAYPILRATLVRDQNSFVRVEYGQHAEARSPTDAGTLDARRLEAAILSRVPLGATLTRMTGIRPWVLRHVRDWEPCTLGPYRRRPADLLRDLNLFTPETAPECDALTQMHAFLRQPWDIRGTHVRQFVPAPLGAEGAKLLSGCVRCWDLGAIIALFLMDVDILTRWIGRYVPAVRSQPVAELLGTHRFEDLATMARRLSFWKHTCARHHNDLSSAPSIRAVRWPSLLAIPFCTDGISFHCLSSREEVSAEAEAMRNCISSHVLQYFSGQAHVFSLRRDDQRLATLEIAVDGDLTSPSDWTFEIAGPRSAWTFAIGGSRLDAAPRDVERACDKLRLALCVGQTKMNPQCTVRSPRLAELDVLRSGMLPPRGPAHADSLRIAEVSRLALELRNRGQETVDELADALSANGARAPLYQHMRSLVAAGHLPRCDLAPEWEALIEDLEVDRYVTVARILDGDSSDDGV